jgi:dTDP-4-dehydrorhamnose reductase
MASQPIELWAGVECTVNRVRDAHFDQLVRSGHDRRLTDLDLLAGLGVRRLRYPVLWERTSDWTWPDERLGRLQKLGLDPIVGLVHHGSGPRATNLLDDRFAAGLAAFAGAVAGRYPWVTDWTPVNEPLTTARFSALYGHWYPHAHDDASFVRALLNQLRATVLAMEAIRAVIPEARLVQTEDIGKTWSTRRLAYQAEFENERRWLTYDLLCGTFDRGGVVGRWLRAIGIDEQELRWFAEHPCPPDILGVNHYLSGERFLDHRLERYPAELHGGNGRERYADVLAARVLGAGAAGPGPLLLEVWERYGRPVAVTEAHNGCTREEQLRWLRSVLEGADFARGRGADVRAVTVWSAFGVFGWNELLTNGLDFYEPGAFDVRAPSPRPTALAAMATSLASAGRFEHPVVDAPGWWERPERLHFPPVGTVARAPRHRARPLLITGGTGTLGRAFARLCEERGLAARATLRRELDLTDAVSAARALEACQPWAVVNTAGYVRVDDAEVEDSACLAVNRDGAAILARACAARSIPFVTFSTDLVFDGAAQRPYVESDAVNPLNVYGRSKAEAEDLVLSVHPSALVVRTSAFFGPWDSENFAAATLKSILAGDPFSAAGDVVVSPTYVPDLVHATLDLLIDGECGVWHLANDGAVTWADFARRVAEAAELDARLVADVRAIELGWIAARPPRSALGSERGWIMPRLDDAVARYVATARPRVVRAPRRA